MSDRTYLQTMRHMLGIDDPWLRSPDPWRNYYCANPGDAKMIRMQELGLVELYRTCGGYEWWRCTETGTAAAIQSHRLIRKSRSARTYRAWLEIRDVFDCSFKQFLTHPQFAETRRSA